MTNPIAPIEPTDAQIDIMKAYATAARRGGMDYSGEWVFTDDGLIDGLRQVLALAPAREKSEPAPVAQEPTYSSTQATHCAGCGEHKHTPLRVDAMGGYVCLTCINRQLDEFFDAAPTAAQGLSDARLIQLWHAWSRQGINTDADALQFARAVLALAPK